MMATRTIEFSPECDDAALVSQSRAGNQSAFGQIVARYQSLICSLTYNATGSLSQSEDLAQETFVTAWKHLHRLREPERLRSWLCGIARNLCSTTRRQAQHEPAAAAEPLEAAGAAPAADLLPSDQAISREEQAILWRALEGIPGLYREPLILFYRERQSVGQVAQALELSPEAVKQRLARGRKMLQQEVTAFVEGALQRTTPGKAFTLAVLASLPVFVAGSATAATIGTTTATTAVKTITAAGLIGAILGPLIGLVGGSFGVWMSIKNTRSPRERQFMIRQSWYSAAFIAVFLAASLSLILLGRPIAASHPVAFGCALGLLVVGYATGLLVWIIRSNRRQRQIRIEDGTEDIPLPAAIPSRRRLLWTVYGSLGGSTAGALAWLVAQAMQTQDWVTATITVMFGTAVVLLGGRAWMRNPERRVRVMVRTLAALGLFTAAVGVAHWGSWTKAAGVQTAFVQTILIGAGLTACAAVFEMFVLLRKRQGKPGRSVRFLAALIPPLLAGVSCRPATPHNPRTEAWTLPNSVRVVSVFFPQSTNVSIFTYVPVGLATDGPQQAQWSHLVEHLVIRSTIPADSSGANGETLPDHLRLDFYGTLTNWTEGLSHHQRWLSGAPFTQASLDAEKPKARAEGDYTVKNFATHKFALAAWAQGFRHGQAHAAIQRDMDRASLKDIQGYRDQHFPVRSNVVVCIVGGIEPARVLAVASEQLAAVKLSAAPAARAKLHPGNREMTWDLNARHLVLTWPIPAHEDESFSALLVAAQRLNMQFFSDAELKKQTGMVFAGADLTTPEGNFFYVSASLRPGGSFKPVQEKILESVRQLGSSGQDLSWVPMFGQQQAQMLTTLPNPALMRSQLPPSVKQDMLEMNIGLQWGMNEFRYGSQKLVMAKRLSELKAENVRQMAKKYLVDSSASATILQPQP